MTYFHTLFGGIWTGLFIAICATAATYESPLALTILVVTGVWFYISLLEMVYNLGKQSKK